MFAEKAAENLGPGALVLKNVLKISDTPIFGGF